MKSTALAFIVETRIHDAQNRVANLRFSCLRSDVLAKRPVNHGSEIPLKVVL